MSEVTRRVSVRHGLTFIATLAFMTSFFGSRLFATIFPKVVVARPGIHFHHFWYGIAMVCVAGWLGISWNHEKLERTYALIFGLGAGFIGDEVGLLLTFGDYSFELAFLFFVGAISFIIIATLLLRYREQLERDVLSLSYRERLTLLGIFIAGFSTIFYAFGQLALGLSLSLIGLLVFVLSFERERRSVSLRTLT